MVTWHDNPFIYNKKVKNGQKIHIKVKWLPVHEESNLEISPKSKISDLLSRCRIDIRNKGNKENNIVIIDNDDIEANIIQPKWFRDENGVGTVVDSDTGELSLSFKCINDGKLDIKFKGMDFKDENENRIPIYIDYNEILIDDKPIITKNTSVWHDDPIIYEQEVKNNQIISLKVNWSASESSKDLSDDDEKNITSDDMTINELISKINALKRANKELKEFNEDILNSTSWKMTNVLRKIKQLK